MRITDTTTGLGVTPSEMSKQQDGAIPSLVVKTLLIGLDRQREDTERAADRHPHPHGPPNRNAYTNRAAGDTNPGPL